MDIVSDFMIKLHSDLLDRVSESTATLYLRILFRLNNSKPFNTFAFLKKKDAIMSKLTDGELSENTVKLYLAAIVSVLGDIKDKPTYKKIYLFYKDLMNKKVEDLDKLPKNVKTSKQSDNWLSWEEIEDVSKKLRENVKGFANDKYITPTQYTILMGYMVLSLFTDIPPRRNMDYQDCTVVKKGSGDLPKDRNYYIVSEKKFVFNKFKTFKTYGTQEISIADHPELLQAMDWYLKFHPLSKGKRGSFSFLVNYDSTPMTAVNSITRILNKVFKPTGKKIGSSMLRHIYLTTKYGEQLEEKKQDAEEMGHSLAEQQSYIVNQD